MAIEDSLILSSLLGHAKTINQARLALEVYDSVRRDRTQRVVESSRDTGMIRTGRSKEFGLDLQTFREKLLSRWDFIIDFDNKQHRDEALEMMDRLIDEHNGYAMQGVASSKCEREVDAAEPDDKKLA